MFSFDFIFEKLGRIGKVKQFQLIQEGRDTYRLRICANDPLSDEIGSDVITHLKAILGADAKLDIEYAGEIPVLNSGKRKYIVSNYYPVDDDIPV
jgi:phenylacetate-CoA ligase